MGQPVEVNIKTVRNGWENIKDYDIGWLRFLYVIFHWWKCDKVSFKIVSLYGRWKSIISDEIFMSHISLKISDLILQFTLWGKISKKNIGNICELIKT